jgi:crotonobetainyl-CoA:carnitine CoA-transferase CaiB-like acyl-CoA transferase
MNDETERGILDGIRVLDLSSGISGPVAAMLLAEAGADVIKLEPRAGDPMRASPGFRTWNRSKRGIALDLSDAADREVLESLLEGADVLLHGLRPSLAARHRLDDASLAARFPALVVCSVLGYPVGHADAERPGYDILVQARMGLMDEQRGNRPGPVFLRWPLPSWGAAWLAAIGILARLRARDRSGRGGPAHTSLLQGALAPMMQYWARAERPSPMFAHGLPKNMMSGLYECGDGVWIHMMGGFDAVAGIPLVAEVIASIEPAELEQARRDIAALQSPPTLTHDPALLVAVFRRRPSAEWLELLWAHDIAVLASARPGDVLREQQARVNGYVTDVEDPELGRLSMAGSPYEAAPAARVRRPAPRLGEHAREVQAERVRPARERIGPARNPARAAGEAPLAGVRVLDLGNFLAGPFAPMLMADLGAEVIKLEATTGDQMRPVARSFCGCQRGKRSIALDLKQPAARPVLEELVRRADVVHHNLRYPAARKLRIDYETLRALKPDLVYCHTSSYGPRGERADWPGYDQLFQACSGWEVAGGGPGNPPIWHRMGMMDHQNALASLFATLLALRERERTGRGQFVKSSILGAAVLTMSELYLGPDGALPPFPEIDPGQTGVAPGYRIYRASDGWLAVAALGSERLAALVRAAGARDAAGLEAAIASRKQAELLAALERAGVPAEEVRLEQEQAFLDRPEHRQSRLAVAYPHAQMGTMEQVGAYWNLVDLPLRLDLAPPALGQHTAEILAELGYGAAQLEAWVEAGVAAVDDRHAPQRMMQKAPKRG